MIVVLQTFILQLEGKTKWKLFKPLQELPQEASPDLELSDIGEASHEFDMEVLNVFLECFVIFRRECILCNTISQIVCAL